MNPLLIPVIHNLHIGLGISNLLPKCSQRTVLSHGVTKQAAQQSNHINGKMPLTLFDHIHDILQRIVQEVGIDLSLQRLQVQLFLFEFKSQLLVISIQCILHQPVNPLQHPVEGNPQLLDFINGIRIIKSQLRNTVKINNQNPVLKRSKRRHQILRHEIGENQYQQK
ncbi:hypothetical protein D3C76_1359000 [compost metagenome]